MATATAELTMSASPDTVWAVVRDFHGLADWMPGIEKSVAEGDDRVLSMMGMTIRERLVKCDEDAKALTYSIIDGAPVESHEATITVHRRRRRLAGHLGRHCHSRRDGRADAGHVPAGARVAEDQSGGLIFGDLRAGATATSGGEQIGRVADGRDGPSDPSGRAIRSGG